MAKPSHDAPVFVARKILEHKISADEVAEKLRLEKLAKQEERKRRKAEAAEKLRLEKLAKQLETETPDTAEPIEQRESAPASTPIGDASKPSIAPDAATATLQTGHTASHSLVDGTDGGGVNGAAASGSEEPFEIPLDDARRQPDSGLQVQSSTTTEQSENTAISEAVPLVTVEMTVISEGVKPYMVIRTPVPIDKDGGFDAICQFCDLVFSLPTTEAPPKRWPKERKERVERATNRLPYDKPILFDMAVAAGELESAPLRLALDHALLLRDDHYNAFLSWVNSLESWLYERLVSTPAGRAVLDLEVKHFKARK
jgi:hypothetical protein